MPAPITVIIPTLNTATTLGPTLACVFQGMDAGLVHELIFADGGSGDEIAQIAEEIGATFITTQPGRGSQLAAGAAVAKTEWLLFLHADTTLDDRWVNVAATHIKTSPKAAYFDLKFDAKSIPAVFVAFWANLRSRLFQLPYGDQGLLISTALYSEVDGYPNIPLMEDVAIARKLRSHLISLNIPATTSAAKYIEQGWLKRGSKNIATLIRYIFGASPGKLAKSYKSR